MKVYHFSILNLTNKTHNNRNIKIQNSLFNQLQILECKEENRISWYFFYYKFFIEKKFKGILVDLLFMIFLILVMLGLLSFFEKYNWIFHRTYVSIDILQRILSNYFGYNIIHVMGITDIDDKIINKAIQEKKNFKEIAR